MSLLAVLQPNACVTPRESPFIRHVVDLWGRNIQTVMRIQYAAFRDMLSDRRYFVDLSGALDDWVEDAYVDWMHLSWRGNDLVATRLAEYVAPPRGGESVCKRDSVATPVSRRR